MQQHMEGIRFVQYRILLFDPQKLVHDDYIGTHGKESTKEPSGLIAVMSQVPA